LGEDLKCGAYEGHCCQRGDDDAFSVGGIALVFVEFESIPDVINDVEAQSEAA
jgi:hypothetical protein